MYTYLKIKEEEKRGTTYYLECFVEELELLYIHLPFP